MICKPCTDGNHSECSSRLCRCADCAFVRTSCRICSGEGRDPEHPSLTCYRCQGSGRELADLAGVDRLSGRHGGNDGRS